jgi:hypothetical protein
MEQKFNTPNKPLPKRMSSKEENLIHQQGKNIKISFSNIMMYFSKNDQDIGKAEHFAQGQ